MLHTDSDVSKYRFSREKSDKTVSVIWTANPNTSEGTLAVSTITRLGLEQPILRNQSEENTTTESEMANAPHDSDILTRQCS